MERILVTRPYLPDLQEYKALLDRIWSEKWLTNNGPLLVELQQKLCDYVGTENLSLQTNGHLSLEMALQSLHIRGEVITTPFTFASTTHAIARCGAKPVFCDIREDNLTLDLQCIERLITDETTAIMPVHVYGHPCDTDAIEDIAKRHHLKVIYDAAHSFGVRVDNISLACRGDISMYSFHSTKLFHSIEGGALVYRDKALQYELDGLRNYGIRTEEKVDLVGGNAKMNEFQAAMGLLNLEHIDEIIAERKAITMLYRKELSAIEGVRFFTPENEHVTYNYAYMPVLINKKAFGKSRDTLYHMLKEYDIYTRRYFYPLTSDFECYRAICPPDEQIPVARRAAGEVLALPIYNGLTEETVMRICDAIRRVQRS